MRSSSATLRGRGIGLALALLALAAALPAQVSFGPLRLDDSTQSAMYYPDLSRLPGDSLLCTWAFSGPSLYGAYGQLVSTDGDRIRERILYEQGSPPTLTCPPDPAVVRLAGGGEVRLLYHA